MSGVPKGNVREMLDAAYLAILEGERRTWDLKNGILREDLLPAAIFYLQSIAFSQAVAADSLRRVADITQEEHWS